MKCWSIALTVGFWLSSGGPAVAGDLLDEPWHADALAESVELRAEAPQRRAELDGLRILLVDRIPDRLAADSGDLADPSGEEVRRTAGDLARGMDLLEMTRLLDFYAPAPED